MFIMADTARLHLNFAREQNFLRKTDLSGRPMWRILWGQCFLIMGTDHSDGSVCQESQRIWIGQMKPQWPALTRTEDSRTEITGFGYEMPKKIKWWLARKQEFCIRMLKAEQKLHWNSTKW